MVERNLGLCFLCDLKLKGEVGYSFNIIFGCNSGTKILGVGLNM